MFNDEILRKIFEDRQEEIEEKISKEYHSKIKEIKTDDFEERNNIKMGIISELYYKQGFKDGVNFITLRKVVKYTGASADYLLFGKNTSNETIQRINNILALNSETTSDFIYHIVLCSNDFCNKLSEEQKI